jgi:hypothetical protein
LFGIVIVKGFGGAVILDLPVGGAVVSEAMVVEISSHDSSS